MKKPMPIDSPVQAKLPLELIEKRGNLVASLSQMLEKEIVEGRLRPGNKLPTEAELARGTGVSRTVVREAVASLRSAGLVESRQGAGVFVLAFSPRIGRFPDIPHSQIQDILSVLELRLAVEVEAAALAASRRTDADIIALESALDALELARATGDPGIAVDVAFHHAIAQATHNPYFVPLLASLGDAALPRRRLSGEAPPMSDMSQYLALVLAEHRAIKDAIVARDSALAAAAMRAHLAGSRTRYAALLRDNEKSAK